MRSWTAPALAVGALAALAGCGADAARPPPEMFVAVAARWDDAPATQEAFGASLITTVRQRRVANRCDPLPAPVRFTIDGQEAGPSDADPVSGCFDFSVTFGPTPAPRDTVTVSYESEGAVLATAAFSGLAPGLKAALAVPADGQVRAGDEVVVVPPPELPTSSPGVPRFYPLDAGQASSWVADGVRPAEPAARLPDGIHVKVPPLVGRVALVVDGTGLYLGADVSCDGFGACAGSAANVVGPVYLTVQP
jgi:hypothetical protein